MTPVYLRCRAGRITWLYPRGALRVILRLHNSNKDFRVCIRILSSSSEDDQEPDLYSEDRVLDFREFRRKSYDFKKELSVDDDYVEEDDFPFASEKMDKFQKLNKTKKEEFPARLFLEGNRGLLPLYASDDGHGKEVRCFRSKGGQAAVFVEAVPTAGGTADPKRSARLQYDLQTLPVHSYDPAAEECRPCTDQEMANAFCTSDLGKLHYNANKFINIGFSRCPWAMGKEKLNFPFQFKNKPFQTTFRFSLTIAILYRIFHIRMMYKYLMICKAPMPGLKPITPGSKILELTDLSWVYSKEYKKTEKAEKTYKLHN